MKLLHTGDLHLGKSLHETSLLDDQRIMLEQLETELERDQYAALVIAGDIYDRTIPGAEAVELFSGFLVRLRARLPELEICIIPGNHDSAQRLSFADRILGTQHIHIIGNPEDSFEPIILGKNAERLAVFLLPFLAAGTLKPARSACIPVKQSEMELDFCPADGTLLLSQADLASEASRRFAEALSKPEIAGIPTVLVAHLFTLAGKTSESERIFLGQAEQVNPALFSRFTYVALGHLHRTQKITDRMHYSGSPLAYSFDESGSVKNFLKVEIDCASTDFPVTVTQLPIVPRRTVTRLEGSFSDFYTGTAFDRHAADYLEITLTDGSLIANPMNLLKPKFPCLLAVKQGLADDSLTGVPTDAKPEANSAQKGGMLNPVSDFRKFEDMLHGCVDESRVELFTNLLSECIDET